MKKLLRILWAQIRANAYCIYRTVWNLQPCRIITFRTMMGGYCLWVERFDKGVVLETKDFLHIHPEIELIHGCDIRKPWDK